MSSSYRSSDEIFADLGAKRRGVVQGFLWALLLVVVTAVVINVIQYAPISYALVPHLPNLIFIAFIALALIFNSRGRLSIAVWLVVFVMLATGRSAGFPRCRSSSEARTVDLDEWLVSYST